MNKNDSLRCQLITPDREVFDVEATSVVFPAHDGQLGVLNKRAPLLCKMGIGVCKVTTSAGTRIYYVDGGFARVLDNRLTILTQHAQSSEEIDIDAARQALAEAQSRSAPHQNAQRQRQADIQRAATQIKVAGQ